MTSRILKNHGWNDTLKKKNSLWLHSTITANIEIDIKYENTYKQGFTENRH